MLDAPFHEFMGTEEPRAIYLKNGYTILLPLLLLFSSMFSLAIGTLDPVQSIDGANTFDGTHFTEARAEGATAWETGMVDGSNDVGAYVDAAVGAEGDVWLSYYDSTQGDVKVAHYADSAWSTETVATTGDVGRFSSIALDPNGLPRVVYQDTQNQIVRISRFDGSIWNSAVVAPGEDTGDNLDFAIDADGGEWVTYHTSESDGSNLFGIAHYDGGSWTTEYIEDGSDVYEGCISYADFGKHPSLIINSNGLPEVAYHAKFSEYDGDVCVPHYQLRYARSNGVAWSTTIVTDGGYSMDGMYPSMVIDSEGHPKIAYHNDSWSADDLRFASFDGSNWHTEIVDNNGSTGFAPHLLLDNEEREHILYHEDWSGDLLLAKREGETWELLPVVTEGDSGSHLAGWLDADGREGVAYFEAGESDLLFAIPGTDSDGDGITDDSDRCPNTNPDSVTDEFGCGWSHSKLTTDGENYRYVSAAKGPAGLLHVAYWHSYDDGNWSCTNSTSSCNLVLLTEDGLGDWNREVVQEIGDVGEYNSIAIDAEGNEHIAYLDRDELDLKVARRVDGGWEIDTVDNESQSGYYAEILLDSEGREHVTYFDYNSTETNNRSVKLASNVDGEWVIRVVDDENITSSFSRPDSVIGPDGTIQIVYHTDVDKRLRLTTWDGEGFTTEFIPDDGDLNSWQPDLKWDDNGVLHILYQRETNNGSSDFTCDSERECILVHATLSDGEWANETVKQFPSRSWNYASLVLDEGGRPHVAYMDTEHFDTALSVKTPFGWEHITFNLDGSTGYYGTNILDDAGYDIILTFDGTNDELEILKRDAWDDDHDWIPNDLDACPESPVGSIPDDTGCTWGEEDDDGDGILNWWDDCPNTLEGEIGMVNATGCGPSERDSDGDGVVDSFDACPQTNDISTVDAYGCSDEQRDSDEDGIPDGYDLCPNTPRGESVDWEGCGSSQLDRDSDGVSDADDAFPLDATQTTDSDEDGYGDNQSEGAKFPDGCPNIPGLSNIDRFGCPDMDEDGYSDEVDPDDDGDGHSDTSEIENGTNPFDSNDWPGKDSGGGSGNENPSDGNPDDGGSQQQGEGEDEGINIAILGGFAVVVLVAIGGLWMFAKGRQEGEIPLDVLGAPPPPAPAAVEGEGQMIPTDLPCPGCGAGKLVFIPAYGRHYCAECESYH